MPHAFIFDGPTLAESVTIAPSASEPFTCTISIGVKLLNTTTISTPDYSSTILLNKRFVKGNKLLVHVPLDVPVALRAHPVKPGPASTEEWMVRLSIYTQGRVEVSVHELLTKALKLPAKIETYRMHRLKKIMSDLNWLYVFSYNGAYFRKNGT